jgi:hypothetical protein
MYSETLVMRDVYGPIWCVVMLDAAASVDGAVSSFPDVMREYARPRRALLSDLIRCIHAPLLISEEMKEVAETESTWASPEGAMRDDEDLAAWIALSLRTTARPEWRAGSESLRPALKSAIDRTLVDLFYALTSAFYAFGRAEVKDQFAPYARAVFARIDRVLLQDADATGGDARLCEAFTGWERLHGLSDLAGSVPVYIVWMEAQMPTVAKLCAR